MFAFDVEALYFHWLSSVILERGWLHGLCDSHALPSARLRKFVSPNPFVRCAQIPLLSFTSSVMAPMPSVLFARDIVRFSDAELDQYLEDNARSGLSELSIL
jgi:hypothetical protein